jgi:PAS domain S-box-containing protein
MRFNDQLINLPSLNHVINRSPLTINPNSFVVEAIVLMSQERCSNYAPTSLNSSLDLGSRSQPSSCVLVLEEADLLGIFTEKDVLRLIASGMDLSTVTIAEVMTQPVVTLKESEIGDIFIALSLLRQHQTNYLPVLDDRGQLVGIITQTSLLQAFDMVKIVGVVEGLQEYLQKPRDEFRQVNQPIEIEQVRYQTQNNLRLWVEAQSAEIMQVNQELQQALEELQVVEEELREQNEELAIARELVELERQLYQDLFEFAPDGYLVTDTAGIIQEANRAAAILLGVHQKYLVNKPLILFIAHQDRKTFTIQLNNEQQEQQCEAYLKPRGGTAFPASIRAAAMYDSEGKQVGWRWLLCDISDVYDELRLRQQAKERLCKAYEELEQRVAERTAELVMSNILLQQEITERQRAEVALHQSENLYRHLVESQIDIIIRIDLQGQITFANAAACQTFGRKEDEFCGQSFFQFLHPDDLPEAMEDITNLESSSYPLTNRERRALTINGIRWFQWNAIAIHNDKGEVVEIQGVGRDITEKQTALQECQLAEAALRQSEEKFRNFVENTHAIISIVSPDSFHPLYVSPAYENIWGRSCQSLYDQPDSWLEAIHPDDRDRATKSVEQLLSAKSSSAEYRILRPDNSVRWIWNRGFAVYDDQGEVDYYGCIAEDITERKLSEDSLRQSEEKFRTIAENIHAAIWIANPDSFRTLYVSPGYEKIWGRSCHNLLDHPESWIDSVHPDDRNITTIAAKQQLKGESASIEYRILRPDGSMRWIWDRSFTVYDDQGKVQYYGGIAEDITERKLAEGSLQESEARLSLATEAVEIGIWDRNLIANTGVWSANMGPLYGLPANTLCPTFEDYLNLVHPEDRESVAASIDRMIKEGKGSIEYRIVWPDGSLHWLNCKGQVYYNEIGQPIRIIGTNRDVTESKLAKQKISEQAALLDIATDAILVRDFQSQLLFWNKGAERMYGWLSTEVIGKDLQEILYSAETQQQLEIPLKKVIESGSWQGELCQVTKSGKEIVVESRWTLMRDAEGEPKSILTVDTDITEKKQLEEQFFRTQRLESLGTLAGGIAHDLNNILTPILAAAQLLQGTFFQDDQERFRQMLALVETNAKRGAALVKRILSFARGFKEERTIIQIEYLISEIIQIAKQTFPKSIKFSTVIPEDIWAITGDTTQLHQVLMNLVVNARDALPDGGNIKISAENKFIDEAYTRMNFDAKVGPYIVITVADNGIGIPPDILNRIFEPFFTTKDVNTGTGLGLSTVLGIIRSHDGFIKVSNNVTSGSKFDLFLPAVAATQGFNIEEIDLLPGQGELILVVDDEAQIREIVTIILENHNYKILTASNGIEAIALYAQHKHQINAVLMDIMMPDMDGITAIRTLQKINKQVQIIACSGLNLMQVFDQADDANVQAVLLKPYTAKELLKSLHHLFRG